MTLNDLKLRARALLRPNRVEQELAEELAFHIEREARKLIDEGMTPAEARQRAQVSFGSTALASDRCRRTLRPDRALVHASSPWTDHGAGGPGPLRLPGIRLAS